MQLFSIYGELLDTNTTGFDLLSLKRWQSIVHFKASIYTYIYPIKFGKNTIQMWFIKIEYLRIIDDEQSIIFSTRI